MARSEAQRTERNTGGREDMPQAGIFALGTASHAYLEFDLLPSAEPRDLVVALADLREPRTTIGGVNLVIGFRPELWRDHLGAPAPAAARGFNTPLSGPDGYTMPATQHDALLWLAGSAYDVVFDEARGAIGALAGVAAVRSEVSSWPYRHDRDLTGFVDGTENPSLARAPEVALVAPHEPGAGGSVLLLQQWAHDVAAWESLPVSEQERAMGRTKADSIELEDAPVSSHVSRTDQEDFGEIFRRNMPYGTVTAHGTMFVGFAAEQGPLERMLESMAGRDGVRDELTRYTTPLTGAYYFVPSVSAIRQFASDPEDD
jgi:porphyrinogen peroxidase